MDAKTTGVETDGADGADGADGVVLAMIDALKGLRLKGIYLLPSGLLLLLEQGCGIMVIMGRRLAVNPAGELSDGSMLILGVRGANEPISAAELEPLSPVRLCGPGEPGAEDRNEPFGELMNLAGMPFAGAMRMGDMVELHFGGDAVITLGAGAIAVVRGKGVVQ